LEEVGGTRGGTPAREKPKTRRKRNGSYPEDFEWFWSVYPRPTEKAEAYRAWREVNPDEALTERILAAVEAQTLRPDWIKEGGKFIPYPQKWLRRGRWEDREPEMPFVSDATATNFRSGAEWLKQHEFDEEET